jgi:hypothetical protein
MRKIFFGSVYKHVPRTQVRGPDGAQRNPGQTNTGRCRYRLDLYEGCLLRPKSRISLRSIGATS